MKVRFVVALCCGFSVLIGVHQPASAQVVLPLYVPGWNMVGGTPGESLSPAAEVLSYNLDEYVLSAPSISTGCDGHWAYFRDAVEAGLDTSPQSMAASAPGTVRQCSVRPGWNMVGNPFVGVARLPAGISGFYWDPDIGQYVRENQIPVGGSVWISATSASTLSLTNT